MSNVIQTKIDGKLNENFLKFKEDRKISSYAALKIIMDEYFEEKINEKPRTFEEDLKTKDEPELLKLYNKIADNERKSIKLKKGGAWGPQIFYHDMKNLIANKAPPTEFIMFASIAEEKSLIINRLMDLKSNKLRKRDMMKIDWSEHHWKSARGILGPGMYLDA